MCGEAARFFVFCMQMECDLCGIWVYNLTEEHGYIISLRNMGISLTEEHGY